MIKNRQYKDFSLRLHDKGGRRPIVGQLELTYRCNLCCQHCYIVNDTKRRELDYKDFCRIIDDIHREGCLWLCLTGGEPLLREDFLDIYTYAYKKGFILTIFTNATLLNAKILKYLKKFPPFCIEITLNAATKKTYELITQVKDSFERAMRGIELIRKYNLPLKLKCQVMVLNIDEFSSMRKLYQRMGVKFRSSILIDPRIDGSTEPCSLRLPIEKIAELRKRKEIIEGRDEIEDGFAKRVSFSNNLFRCPGGTWAFYISPFGELFFCNSLRKPSWDLRKRSFKQGFYEFFLKIRSLKFKTNSPCKGCRLQKACLWCPGRAYLETGDMEAPIPYYCETAKLTK